MKNFDRIEDYFRERTERGFLPGAAAAVSIGGELCYECRVGYADLESGRKLGRDALFRLASMTKPLTAAACLIAEEEGLFRLTDEVADYIPGFAEMWVGRLTETGGVVRDYRAGRRIRIDDLLGHCSGLGSGPVGDLQFGPAGNHGAGSVLSSEAEGCSRKLLDFSPGERQAYSAHAALDVAAALVERVSKCGYYDYLKSRILDPLGMTDTVYAPDSGQAERVVPLYKRISDDPEVPGLVRVKVKADEGFYGYPAGYTGGGAGLFSTLGNYMKFAGMLAGKGRYEKVRVLSEGAVERMSTPRYALNVPGITPYFNWGIGVRVAGTGGVLPAGSFGWSGAYNTHFWVDPSRKLAAVLLSSADNAGGADSPDARALERLVMQTIDG